MLTIVGTLAGSIIWVYSTIDGKVAPTEAKAQQATIEISALKEAITTIKDDNKIIKDDIKELLKRIK